MGLIPDPASMVSRGVTGVFRGLRSGDQRTLLAGAAFAALGLYRRSRRPKKVLLRRIVVPEGESVVIRRGDDRGTVEVRRVDRVT